MDVVKRRFRDNPKVRFALDSALEGAGFEASVPREIGHDFEDASSYDGGLGERPAPRAGSTDRIYTTGLPGAL
jgi:hypothetical protein